MPTYLLYQDDRVRIPSRTLHLSARQTRTGRPIQLRTEVDSVPDGSAYHASPELTVLPAPTRPLLVRVLSDAAAFAEGTSVTLRLVTEVPPGSNDEVDEIVVDAVDVSGLASRVLVLLAPDAGWLTVSAMNGIAEDPVDGFAARVRSTARTVLGDELPDPDRVDLLAGVDVSASMRPALADGSVAALVDAVVGLSYVVGRPGRVRAGLLGRRPSWLPEMPGRELSGALVAEIRRSGLECGFHQSSVAPPPGIGADQPMVMFLITDTAPPHARTLARAGKRDRVTPHILVSGWAGACGASPTGPRLTVLEPPPPTASAVQHLLQPSSAPVVETFVASLVAPWTTELGSADAHRRGPR